MLIKSLSTVNTVFKISSKIFLVLISIVIVVVLFFGLFSKMRGLCRLSEPVIIIQNLCFLFDLDQSTSQFVCMHHHIDEFRMELLDQLIVEFDLTEGTGVLVFIPSKDTLAVEIVAFIAWKDDNLHIVFKKVHADATFSVRIEQVRIVNSLIESHESHGWSTTMLCFLLLSLLKFKNLRIAYFTQKPILSF